jgi:hypothetical protein
VLVADTSHPPSAGCKCRYYCCREEEEEEEEEEPWTWSSIQLVLQTCRSLRVEQSFCVSDYR